MPKRIGPNAVEFQGEFSVRLVSRTQLKYEEDRRVLNAEVEPGDRLAVYLSAATQWHGTDTGEFLTSQDRARIGANITLGLSFLRIPHLLA